MKIRCAHDPARCWDSHFRSREVPGAPIFPCEPSGCSSDLARVAVQRRPRGQVLPPGNPEAVGIGLGDQGGLAAQKGWESQLGPPSCPPSGMEIRFDLPAFCRPIPQHSSKVGVHRAGF